MKRIAIITPMLQPYRISFYEKLAGYDRGYEFMVFHGVSSREGGRPGYRGETSFRNQGFPEKKYRFGPFTLVYNKGLYSGVVRFDPDLVILQGIAGDIANRRIAAWTHRKGKSLILWTCGWEPGLAKGVFLSFKNYLVSTFFRKARLHLTYSSKANRYVESMGVDREMIRTCYNGIEIDHLVRDEESVLEESKAVSAEYGLEGYITFLYVGGIIPEKKVDLLIEAFSSLRKRYSNIKLLIIGDGPLKEMLIRTTKEKKDPNIYYLGRIMDGVDKYFAASDCLVLPGAGGLALNQAMFWRKTCIVSEADGTEDDLVIEGETGYRFIKDSAGSLHDAMERRINTVEERIGQMAEAARTIIEKKSNVNNMVEIFMEGIRDLLPS